jgi:F0F1-type ATP synthase gamma subunit
MPKTQLIKSEIQEIQKLKDIAEIMAAIAAGNLILYKQSRSLLNSPYYLSDGPEGKRILSLQPQLTVIDAISQIVTPFSKPFLTFHPAPADLEQSITMNLMIGSDMGFCGKFNKGIKEIGKEKHEALCLIGKQLTGLNKAPIALPELKVTGNPEEKAKSVIEKTYQYAKNTLFGEQGIIDNSFESMRIVFNVLDNQNIGLHQCIIHLDGLQTQSVSNDAQVNESPLYNHVFFDLYEKADTEEKEYLIFDPSFPKIQEALLAVKKQILVQVLTTCIIDSMIAENHSRSSSMESTKDEAQQIIFQLNKKMAKERQARITGELIELITSFTSLNQAV